jgi:hypothetical protein
VLTLSIQAFERARRFIRLEARPLERALFEHLFEGAPADGAVAELARFQNEDGGFGRALEPDLRTPSSSALGTGIALRILKESGMPAEHPMVRRAVAYLQSTLDEERGTWRVVPADTNDYPHAPWWHDEDGSLARTFDDFLVIPRAELVGMVHHYGVLVAAGWLEELTERTVRDIETIELGTGGGDDLVYALALAATEALPERYRERLLARIRTVAPQVVSRDPAEWGSYCITPLKVAPRPDSVVADLLAEIVPVQLDYLIGQQSAAGSWDPVWSWGDAYPEAWERAKREWRGELTLNTLKTLRAYGRLTPGSDAGGESAG